LPRGGQAFAAFNGRNGIRGSEAGGHPAKLAACLILMLRRRAATLCRRMPNVGTGMPAHVRQLKVISNNEPTKRIVHEKHEKHEQDVLLFVLFVPFVDSVFCLWIRFLMGCSFSGIT